VSDPTSEIVIKGLFNRLFCVSCVLWAEREELRARLEEAAVHFSDLIAQLSDTDEGVRVLAVRELGRDCSSANISVFDAALDAALASADESMVLFRAAAKDAMQAVRFSDICLRYFFVHIVLPLTRYILPFVIRWFALSRETEVGRVLGGFEGAWVVLRKCTGRGVSGGRNSLLSNLLKRCNFLMLIRRHRRWWEKKLTPNGESFTDWLRQGHYGNTT
jgi:hypothetical protein